MMWRVDHRYTYDGECVDISELKIYWDTQKNQFRHMFHCCECGVKLGCMCYNSLMLAIDCIETGRVCESCAIGEALDGMSVEELSSDFEGDRVENVNAFIESIVTNEEREQFKKETGCNVLDGCDLMEIIYDNDRVGALKAFIVNMLTDDEKHDIMIGYYDGFMQGEVCNV